MVVGKTNGWLSPVSQFWMTFQATAESLNPVATFFWKMTICELLESFDWLMKLSWMSILAVSLLTPTMARWPEAGEARLDRNGSMYRRPYVRCRSKGGAIMGL